MDGKNLLKEIITKFKPKEIRGRYKRCLVREDTGDYKSFIDCIACYDEGHIKIN